VFRSQGGPTTTANVVLVCVACHAAIHAHRLRVVGTDANAGVTFIEASTQEAA
jgi:predicted HNH restriction endonuclease